MITKAPSIIAFGFLCVAIVLYAGANKERVSPNIIFIMADDLGYGELGSYGQTLIDTPNLDRMAREGMRFTQFYSASTVCAPAREALMRGLHTGHTARHGNAGFPLISESPVVGEILQSQGYATAMIGKWALGEMGSGGEPHYNGFDHWFGYLRQRDVHRHYPEWLLRNGEKVFYPGNHGRHGSVYSSDAMMEEAEEFVRRNRDNAFFLYFPMTLPHADIVVPECALAPYKGRFPETPFGGGHYTAQPTPNAATAAMISLIDEYVGRLLALLQELGIDDRTIVFFTSDNGPVSVGGRDVQFFNGAGPLRGWKRDLYEGGIRVPMIVRWPGRTPEGAVSHLVWSLTDVVPTLAELAGTTVHTTDGVSVAPALTGAPQDLGHRALYWAWQGRPMGPGGVNDRGDVHFVQTVRLGDWKAVRLNRSDSVELYDLSEDIGETSDLSGQHPDLVAQMRAIMEREHSPAAPTP